MKFISLVFSLLLTFSQFVHSQLSISSDVIFSQDSIRTAFTDYQHAFLTNKGTYLTFVETDDDVAVLEEMRASLNYDLDDEQSSSSKYSLTLSGNSYLNNLVSFNDILAECCNISLHGN
jgi:hypothetical protein